MDVHLTKTFISEISPEELLLPWADYKALWSHLHYKATVPMEGITNTSGRWPGDCLFSNDIRATQYFGSHGTRHVSWQPCQQRCLCWCSSQDCHSTTPLLSPMHIRVWTQDCPNPCWFLPRCVPFFCCSSPLPCTTSETLLICCLGRMDSVTYRIQPVDRTAWISTKAEILLFR